MESKNFYTYVNEVFTEALELKESFKKLKILKNKLNSKYSIDYLEYFEGSKEENKKLRNQILDAISGEKFLKTLVRYTKILKNMNSELADITEGLIGYVESGECADFDVEFDYESDSENQIITQTRDIIQKEVSESGCKMILGLLDNLRSEELKTIFEKSIIKE
jgi:hypothetical protein